MATVERERVRTEVTVREVLHRAAYLLEEWGWGQGAYFCGGNYCVFGAIAAAAGCTVLEGGPDTNTLGSPPQWQRDLVELAVRRTGFSSWDLAQWNDEPTRTRAEVVARLREAAEAA